MASFVPNEPNSTLGGEQKVMYAKNGSGEFNRVNYGSSAEEFATLNAVNEFKLLEEEALLELKDGISSPIKYFMYKNRMDLPTLCGFVGMFRFRVKKHLQLKHFLKLNDKILQKYADAFGITIKQLKSLENE